VRRSGRDRDPRTRVEHVDHRQLVSQADFVVVEIVRWRDLHAARTELGVDVFVGDDRNAPAGEGQLDFLADEVAIAFVARVHRDRRVAEHRLRSGRRDD
jgi:hypothetical protein